jgi:hypothetical protein
MTSVGLGEMFEGDSADTCAEKFRLMLMGEPSGVSSVHRPWSEDPHRKSSIIDGTGRELGNKFPQERKARMTEKQT